MKIKKILLIPFRLAKKARLAIILVLIGALLIGSGVYFYKQPKWTKQNWIEFYNIGVMFYQKRNFNGAAEWFHFVSQGAKDPKIKSLALYNLGTMVGEEALYNTKLSLPQRMEVAKAALARLNEAIRLDPNDEDAKFNKEILENLLKEILKEIQLPKDQSQAPKEPKPGPGYSPGRGPSGV